MKEYLKIFSIIWLLFVNHTQAFSADISHESMVYPEFNVSMNGKKAKLIFLKEINPSNYCSNCIPATTEVYDISISGSNNGKKRYVTKIIDEELVSVFSNDGISNGKSVYLITRSKSQDTTKHGYFYNTTELPIIDDGISISVNFFAGDPIESELQNCFDGYDSNNKLQISCGLKTENSINEYIIHKHIKIVPYNKEGETLPLRNISNLENEIKNNCKDISKNTFTSTYICSYPNHKLADIYYRIKKIDKNISKFLRNTIPTENINYQLKKYDVEVNYTLTNKNKLEIVLSFSGGVTTLIFEEKNGNTTLVYELESDG